MSHDLKCSINMINDFPVLCPSQLKGRQVTCLTSDDLHSGQSGNLIASLTDEGCHHVRIIYKW